MTEKGQVLPPEPISGGPDPILVRAPLAWSWARLAPRLTRFALGLGSLALFAWALVEPRFQDAEGSLTGRFGLGLAASVALLILALTVTSDWRRFGLWLSVALLGQAVSLQMIEAGNTIHWQHYSPLPSLVHGPRLMLLLGLLLQTVLVGLGLRLHWAAIWAWLTQTFAPWQRLGLALVVLLPSAAVQPSVPLYLGDLALAAFIQCVNLGAMVLVAWSLPDQGRRWLSHYRGWLTRDGEPSAHAAESRLDRATGLAAVWVTLVASLFAVGVYQQHPHITDEVGYFWHARLLAQGLLALPAPPVPAAFEIFLIEVKNGLWYVSMPPGWPALLAVGFRLGAPGLVNPVLAGLNILLAYLLVHDLYDRPTARLTTLLLSISPWYVFMAMNFMTHMFSLTCALLAALGIVWARRTGHTRWAALAGGMVGLGSLIRPLDGLIVGGLLGLWAIGLGGRRLKWTSLVALAVGALVVGAITLPYNAWFTGKPTVFPLNVYMDEHLGVGKNDYGFGPDRGYGWPIDALPGHTPLEGVINASLNVFSINVELLGWSTGSLLLVALALFSRSLRKSDGLMVAVCLAVIAAYFPYWFSGGPDFGARYWFLLLLPCVVLSGRGIQFLAQRLGAEPVLAAVLALCLLTVVNYFPWRALDKYHNFWGMRPDVQSLAADYHFGRSLVLVQGEVSHPDYASAAVYNPLDLNSDAPVYAWDRSLAVRDEVLAAFAERPVWIVAAPSLTHSQYRVLAGPLSVAQVRAGGAAFYPSAGW